MRAASNHAFSQSILVFVGLLSSNLAAAPAESALWRQFAADPGRSPEAGLPDFSRAGYQRGERAIPRIEGPVFDVRDYGAVPDDANSDEGPVRAAISAAEQAGGGVVYFPKGTYLFWTDRLHVEPIWIRSSRIVLRGDGDGEGGSVLHFVHHGLTPGDYRVPKLGNEFNGLKSLIIVEPNQDGGAGVVGKKTLVSEDVPSGSVRMPVKDSGGFKPGDWVVLSYKSKEAAAGLLAGQTPKPAWTKIGEGASVMSIHQIKSAEERALVFADPIHVPLLAKDGPALIPTRMLEEVGVEDLCFRGNWYGRFAHHQTSLDDEAWDALRYVNVVNGWVRRCSFLNVNTAVFLRTSANCSLLENRLAGTRGHYGITVRSGSSGVLNGLSEELAGQAHGPSVGNQSSNVVIWRWSLLPGTSFDSHGNQALRTLVDRVDGGTFMKSGGPESSFPNHLRDLVFWNFRYEGSDAQPIDFWSGSRSQSNFVKPWVVGMAGKPVAFVPANAAVNESPGSFVAPESLYEAQLALRLGSAPGWVDVVKTEWESHRNKALPMHSSRGRWQAGDKGSRYVETLDLKSLIADVSLWFGSFEKTQPVRLSVPDEALQIRADWILMHTLLQNAVFSFGLAERVSVAVIQEGGGMVQIRLRREAAPAPAKVEKAGKGAEQDAADAWTEAGVLAAFMDLTIERNPAGDEVRLRLPGN